MKATAIPSPDASSAKPPRRVFALTGPSRQLDPTTNAARADIADIRLAEQVFAPHYAVPLDRIVNAQADLRSDRDVASARLATLAAGDVFELLDLTGTTAWGVAPALGLVGYVDAALLGPPPGSASA